VGRLHTPTTLDELRAQITDRTVIVGGAVGLMSAAFPAAFGAANVSLARMGLAWIEGRRVGAMTTLAALARSDLGGYRALADAVRLTATPALRRRITLGGALAGNPGCADVGIALGAHAGAARVLDGLSGRTAWHSVARLGELQRPWVLLEVDLGEPGESRYRRFTGHHRAAPTVVSVAGRRLADGATVLCAGGAAALPLVGSPEALPELAGFRGRVMRALAADVCEAVR
jgi:CO/xanthine dehydrogenase FAD-binding subunit